MSSSTMHGPVPWYQRVHLPQGFPSPSTDAAPTAVFLVLFIAGAVANMTILRKNTARGHKFLFNAFCFGFCMARVASTVLRLAFMYRTTNRGLCIAATIFVAAGVLILYIVNLLFAQRILRSLHPRLGWSKAFSRAFLVLYGLVPILFILVLTATVQSFFATNPHILAIDRNLQRAASVYFMVVAFIPIPIVVVGLLLPKSEEPDRFGKGSIYLKAAVVIVSSLLLCLGSTFRVTTGFLTPSPTAWWNAKWCFYFFSFTVEYIVVLIYLVARIDLLFYIPDGSKGPYSYSKTTDEVEVKDIETGSALRKSSSA